ncbi:MAG: 1-acyl-sn-glycerol-3-phosphate acyltransferase [Bacteroidota bacterium]
MSFWIFYEETKFINRKGLHFDYPALVVCNHPSTLIDPLQVASRAKKYVFFVVNAGMFKSAIGRWFFGNFYCIPVQRKIDAKDPRISNRESFKQCDEFLGGGGAIFIAPQGTSQLIRGIGPLKTGPARIALSAASKKDFKLGLKILPVGLNYSHYSNFRSRILIHVGEPIDVADYQSAYEEDQFPAVRQLTDEVKKQLEQLVVDTIDKEEEAFLEKLETIAASEKYLPVDKTYLRSKTILEKIKTWQQTDDQQFNQLKEKAHHYFHQLESLSLEDAAVFSGQQSSSATQLGKDALILLLGLPLFIYGFLNNVLANSIPGFLGAWWPYYPGYKATVKLLSGSFVCYPLFYGLQLFLVHYYFGQIWITLAYLLSIILSALFAWWYLAYARSFFRHWRFRQLAKSKQQELVADRLLLSKALQESQSGILKA